MGEIAAGSHYWPAVLTVLWWMDSQMPCWVGACRWEGNEVNDPDGSWSSWGKKEKLCVAALVPTEYVIVR
jgi:hypothetical protein